MFLSPTGFIFVHNPKVAGTTIRLQLQEQIPQGVTMKGYEHIAGRIRDVAHIPLFILKEANPTIFEAIAFNGFVLVRNPYTRAVSSFIHSIRQHRTVNQPYPYENLGEFLRNAPQSEDPNLAHAQPQHWFVCDDGQQHVASVFKLEDVAGATMLLPGAEIDLAKEENDQEIPDYTLDETTKKLVQEVYAKDFELLGFDP